MENKYLSMSSYPNNYTYHIDLYGNLEDDPEYYLLFRTLSEAGSEDTVNINIGSNGGNVEIANMIANASLQSPAKINYNVVRPCYSGAAIIALSGNTLTMQPNTFLMFHNQSCTYDGKHRATIDYMVANEEQYRGLLQHICYPFLSKDEINVLTGDQDIYIYDTDETLEDRIKRHYRKRK